MAQNTLLLILFNFRGKLRLNLEIYLLAFNYLYAAVFELPHTVVSICLANSIALLFNTHYIPVRFSLLP